MALSTTNLTLAQQKQVLSYIAETAAAKSLTAQQIAELSIDQKQALIKAGLITQEQIEAGVTLELSKAQLQKIITSDAISTKDKELILGAFGVTGANLTETSSWEVLGASIKKATAAMLKWLFLTPAGWATLAITAIAGTIVAYNKWGDTLENNRKKLEELKSEAQTISSDLQTFNSELETTQQRILELEGKGNLTFTEAEELENLRKQNNELQRSIDLLKLKEKENNKGKNKTFVKTMQKNVDVEDERVQTGRLNPDDTAETEMITETELIERKFNTLDELQEKLRHASTETEKKSIQEQIDKITKYLSECNEQYIEDAEGIGYIQNPTNEDDRKVNEWLDYINDFQDKMAIAMGGDNAKENAFNRLVDNWKFDELLNPLQKLGKEGKVTAEMLNDPKYDEFIQKLIDIGFISDDTEGSLRYVANAFNGTAQAAQNYITSLKGNDINNFIKNLNNEAKALGTTESELAKLTAAHVIFNNTGLSTEQQQQALQMLAAKIATTSAEMKYLLQLFNYASGNFDAAGASTMTEQERRARTVRSKQYLKDKYGIDLSPIKIPEKEDVNPYTPSGGDKDKGKDNTPDYEDPTEAIINRINLRSDELAQQEEEIQNLIEIAELEKDYKKQISLTNDLIATRKKRVEELNKANDGLHSKAEELRNSTPQWNEEEWFDSQGSATKAYTDFINSRIDAGADKEEIESIKDQFEKISKIKEAWVANAEEITELNKEILQGEKDIADIREESYNEVLDEVQRYADEVSDYYNDINNELDERITKEEALLQIMQGQTDATSKLMDVQTEIDKAIRDSRISLQYLDEEERKGIFNEEDYTKLSNLVKSTQNEIDSLSSRFYNDIIEAYEQDKAYLIETITAEYERQVAMKERELEIAQAQVDLTKKQIQLNNVLAEKNVKQLVERNGQYVWEWVADTDKVRQATEELMDAEAEFKRQEYEQKQQEAIDERQRVIDGIKAEQAANDYRVEKMNEYVDDLSKAIENCVDPVKSFAELAVMLGDAGGDIVNAFYKAVGSISGMGVKTSSSSSSSSGGSGGGSTYTSNPSKEYVSWAKSQMAANSKAWHTADSTTKTALEKANQSLGKAIGSTYNSASGTWKHKYASGTNYTKSGSALMGEEGFEAFINRNGHLIPIAQPTIGNIDSGGVVFNTEQMSNLRSLWDLSNIGKVNVDASLVNRTIPSGNGGTQNTFTGGIVINAPRDYNDFVRQLTQRIKTKSV